MSILAGLIVGAPSQRRSHIARCTPGFAVERRLRLELRSGSGSSCGHRRLDLAAAEACARPCPARRGPRASRPPSASPSASSGRRRPPAGSRRARPRGTSRGLAARRIAGRAGKRCAAFASTSFDHSRTGVRSSRIQIERPCVPTTRSSSLTTQVVHGDRRQVQLRAPPSVAPSSREKHHAALGAEVEQPLRLRVLAHGVQVDVLRQAAGRGSSRSCRSRSSSTGTGACRRGGARRRPRRRVRGVEGRRLDAALTVPHSGRPGMLAVTFVQLLPPSRVTWTRPSSLPTQIRPFCCGRLGDGEDRAVVLDAGVVAGDRPARPLLLRSCRCAVRSGLIAVQRLPAVAGAEQHVGAVVDDLRVVRARPRSAPSTGSGSVASAAPWPDGLSGHDADVARLAGAVVVARDDAEVLAGVDDVRVGRVGDRVAGLAAADGRTSRPR